MDDVDVLYDLIMDYWVELTGTVQFTLDAFRSMCRTPSFDMEESMRVVVSPLDEIVGGMFVLDMAAPPVHPRAYGFVRSDWRRKGIGTWLVQWGEERARQAIGRVPDGTRVSMLIQSSSSHEPTIKLLEDMGFEATRYSWLMMADLDAAPPAPDWPAGIRFQTYEDLPNLEAVFAAATETFRDHWGHVEAEDTEARLERWRYQMETDPTFDPTLWFLAMDGEEIAGFALCSPQLGGEEGTGSVETLGVRRPWRRRGLALALLHHAFGEFHRRGLKQAALGVDAESLTGATRLYLKAGMQVVHELCTYEKELRPGTELGTTSVETS
jgi:GNAT superfamily N-acetyltransferase